MGEAHRNPLRAATISRQEKLVPAMTHYSYWPAIPFPLSISATKAGPSGPALASRLSLLEELALETRGELEPLRRQVTEILIVLASRPTPVAAAYESPARSLSGRGNGHLRFYLFGTFELWAGDKALTHWPSRKSRMLLAYLTMEKNRLLPKDVLVELFWPDSSLSRGSNNLSIAIHQIRTALKELLPGGTHGVRVWQGLYGLDQTLVGWVDLHEFQRSLSDARIALQRRDRGAARRHLLAAVDLYRGEFLESDPYEEWTVEPRRSNAAALGRALAWLAGDAAESKDWERVLDYAREIVRREPCDEEGHRWLMTAYWQLGKRAHALLQYQMCSERLVNDLGVQPSEETQKLFLKIRGGE